MTHPRIAKLKAELERATDDHADAIRNVFSASWVCEDEVPNTRFREEAAKAGVIEASAAKARAQRELAAAFKEVRR